MKHNTSQCRGNTQNTSAGRASPLQSHCSSAGLGLPTTDGLTTQPGSTPLPREAVNSSGTRQHLCPGDSHYLTSLQHFVPCFFSRRKKLWHVQEAGQNRNSRDNPSSSYNPLLPHVTNLCHKQKVSKQEVFLAK